MMSLVTKMSLIYLFQSSFLLVSPLLLLTSINSFCESKLDYLRKTLALETLLGNPNKNIVTSPLLIRFSLCKLAKHAQGYGKNEIMMVLGMKSDADLPNCYSNFKNVMSTAARDSDFLMLNKIIVNYTKDIRSEFMNNGTNFGVQVDQVGFNYPKLAVAFVNRWIDRASLKRLPDVLDLNDIDNQTSILIINAAYLKVTWEFPFDIRLTKSGKFHHHDGNTSMVPMMKRTDSFLFLADSVTDAMYVNLKLASYGFSLTIAVPSTPKDLIRLINQLCSKPDILQNVYKRMKFDRVTVMLPRFKIKSGLELKKYLQKIGLLQVFNETNSGLSGILVKNSKTKNIYLSKVKQKIFIDVDEMGIFRQRINDRIMFPGPYSPREQRGPLVMADHPFLFFINLQHQASDHRDMLELFTGVYYGPAY